MVVVMAGTAEDINHHLPLNSLMIQMIHTLIVPGKAPMQGTLNNKPALVSNSSKNKCFTNRQRAPQKGREHMPLLAPLA
jgi:hypothetical protein